MAEITDQLELPQINGRAYHKAEPSLISILAVGTIGGWALSQRAGWRWIAEVYGTSLVLAVLTLLHLHQEVDLGAMSERELRQHKLWRCVTRPALHIALSYLVLRLRGDQNPAWRTVQFNVLGVAAVWSAYRQSRVDEYLATLDRRRQLFDDHHEMVKLFTEGNWPKAFEAVERAIRTPGQRKKVVAALLDAQKPADVVRILGQMVTPWGAVKQATTAEVFVQLTGGDVSLLGAKGKELNFLQFAYLGKKYYSYPCGKTPVKFLESLKAPVADFKSRGSLWRLLRDLDLVIVDVSSPIFDGFYRDEERDPRVFQHYLQHHKQSKWYPDDDLTAKQNALAWVHWLQDHRPGDATVFANAELSGVATAFKGELSDVQVKYLDKFWEHHRKFLIGPPLCVANWDQNYDIWFETNLKDQPLKTVLDVYLCLAGTHKWDADKKAGLRQHLCKADWWPAVVVGDFNSRKLFKRLNKLLFADIVDVLAIVPPSVTREPSVGHAYRLLTRIKTLKPEDITDVFSPIFHGFYGREKRDPLVFQHYLRCCGKVFAPDNHLTARQNALVWVHWLNHCFSEMPFSIALTAVKGSPTDEQRELLNELWAHDHELLRGPPFCAVNWDKDYDTWFAANIEGQPPEQLLDVYLGLEGVGKLGADKKAGLGKYLRKADWWSEAVEDGFDSEYLLRLLSGLVFADVVDMLSVLPPAVTGERSIGYAYRVLTRLENLEQKDIIDVSSPIFDEFYGDEVLREPAVFQQFLRCVKEKGWNNNPGLSDRQRAYAFVHWMNEMNVADAHIRLFKQKDLTDEQIDVCWKFWRHPPGVFLNWLLERSLDDKRYNLRYEELIKDADAYTKVSAYCYLLDAFGQQRNELLAQLRLSAGKLKGKLETKLKEKESCPLRETPTKIRRLIHQRLDETALCRFRQISKEAQWEVGLLPEILAMPEVKERRELTFELLHPSLWDWGAPGWRKVKWQDMTQFYLARWPLTALEKQCRVKGSYLKQLAWMMKQDWQEVACAKEAFKTVLKEGCLPVESIASTIRNAWNDEMVLCDNLTRVREVLDNDRKIIPALVDELFVHKSSAEQLVWMMVNLPLEKSWAKTSRAVVEAALKRHAKRAWSYINPYKPPDGYKSAIESLMPMKELKKKVKEELQKELRKEFPNRREREREMERRISVRCSAHISAFASEHDIDGGFGPVCQGLIPYLNQYRAFEVACRAFSEEQLKVFFRLPAVREKVIAGLEKWRIDKRLRFVRFLLRKCDDKVLRTFMTDKVLKAMSVLVRTKIGTIDQLKIYALLFRACSLKRLQEQDLSERARLVIEGKYNWKRKSCFCAWSEQPDVMPLAAMLVQCDKPGGANELLQWLQQQEWKNEGRAPHAIERLKKIA